MFSQSPFKEDARIALNVGKLLRSRETLPLSLSCGSESSKSRLSRRQSREIRVMFKPFVSDETERDDPRHSSGLDSYVSTSERLEKHLRPCVAPPRQDQNAELVNVARHTSLGTSGRWERSRPVMVHENSVVAALAALYTIVSPHSHSESF